MTKRTSAQIEKSRVERLAARSYSRAVYCIARLGMAAADWPHEDPPPDDVEGYMRSWHTASRRRGSSLAPEDVRDEWLDAYERERAVAP